MFGPNALILNPAFIAAVAAACVGLATFWSNPRRQVSRLFFSVSLHAALWLICRQVAREGGPTGQVWFRVTTAVGAFIPFHLWLIKEAIATNGSKRLREILSRGVGWLTACTVLAAICFTQWFVPARVGGAAPTFGSGYYFYIGGIILAYGILCRETLQQTRKQTGGPRLELQIVLLGGSAAALTVIVLMGLREVLNAAWVTKIQPLVVLCFFTGTAIAITTTRILDARQILLVALEKTLLIGVIAVCAYWLYRGLAEVLPEPFDFLATTAVALWLAATLSARLDRMFQFYPQATGARQAVFAVAQRETKADSLCKAFGTVLKGWGQTENALILFGPKTLVSGDGIELAGDSTILTAIQQLRWATPERLARERATPERNALKGFLASKDLGVLVVADGPALTALVGVGTVASRRPYTYPQVTQLMELAAIMGATLERAHFSSKVQQAEQLATVGLLGASLAHEIRNPLVSIKTFVQLLPTHYQDPAFRSKFFRLIGDEVGRIDQLTEQLLDLSSPRTYVAKEIELHPILQATLDLVAAKAADRNIEFRMDLSANPDRALTDASAAKQVMLNLCFNAIQAIDSRPSEERWVKIATRNTEGGVEMVIADSGPGIAPEIRSRLFQPFQTTKSTGFGLGLAICSDILVNLNASISVDPPEPGQGASFRVIFPCQPSLS
ncbi:MAG: ATP-binding protein [Opitutaceae bacterium]